MDAVPVASDRYELPAKSTMVAARATDDVPRRKTASIAIGFRHHHPISPEDICSGRLTRLQTAHHEGRHKQAVATLLFFADEEKSFERKHLDWLRWDNTTQCNSSVECSTEAIV